jgi:hypothetical protein
VPTTSLPKSQGHVFYRKLNEVFAEAGFDRMAEELCRTQYHARIGRPSIPPGVYFRMLLVGYFEGLGSQRGSAWRCADSLSLREFLGIPLVQDTPDHSSLTRVRDRLPLEVHAAAFPWVLRWVAEEKRRAVLNNRRRAAWRRFCCVCRFTCIACCIDCISLNCSPAPLTLHARLPPDFPHTLNISPYFNGLLPDQAS